MMGLILHVTAPEPLTCPRCECPLGSYRPHQQGHCDPPTFLLCLLKRLTRFSRAPRPEGSQPAFAWGDIARWLNPYPADYRPALAFSFLLYPPSHRLASRRAVPCGRTTGLPRSTDAARVGKVAALRRGCVICARGSTSPWT
jgi:hypothetical protein